MPANRYELWRNVFRVKGIYNCVASLGLLLCDDRIRAYLGAEPGDPVYRTMFLALCFAFGLGYSAVSRDLTKNHAVVGMGILGQLSVFVVTSWAISCKQPGLPVLYLLPAIVDLVFAAAFLMFAWQYPKSVQRE